MVKLIELNCLEKIKDAISNHDGDLLEEVLYKDLSSECQGLELLIKILPESWHHSHENIALTLQKSKSPESVDSLLQTANTYFEYLTYDNSEALHRKCTWALADIGTSKAKDALRLLALNGSDTVKAYSKKRLDRWSQEQTRKGYHE